MVEGCGYMETEAGVDGCDLMGEAKEGEAEGLQWEKNTEQ